MTTEDFGGLGYNPAEKHKDLIESMTLALEQIGTLFLFELNDAITRNHFENAIKVYYSYLFKRGTIHDYVVRCDVINNHGLKDELVCDTAFRPDEDDVFIYLPVRVKWGSLDDDEAESRRVYHLNVDKEV